jgi:K+-transporting ATPase KdpF subunit
LAELTLSSALVEFGPGSCGGYLVFGFDRSVLAGDPGNGRRLRGAGAEKMSWVYALSGAIALALLVYLVVALFWAEDL